MRLLKLFKRRIKGSTGSKGVDTMADSIDVFKKFYSELTKVLLMIINNLVTKLYSDKLLSGDHKCRIESLPTDEEKTEYFLNKVIKPGLEIKYTKQFNEMLRAMKSSDDCTIVQSLKLAEKMLRHSVRSKLILIRHLEICSDK